MRVCEQGAQAAGFQVTGLQGPRRLDTGMSRLQWAVKGVLTHVVSCKQNSDLRHELPLRPSFNLRSVYPMTRLTHSDSSHDGGAPNSFLPLQFS